jgi:hypothetical protein
MVRVTGGRFVLGALLCAVVLFAALAPPILIPARADPAGTGPGVLNLLDVLDQVRGLAGQARAGLGGLVDQWGVWGQLTLIAGGVLFLLAGFYVYVVAVIVFGVVCGGLAGAALVGADSGALVQVLGAVAGALVGGAVVWMLNAVAVFLSGVALGVFVATGADPGLVAGAGPNEAAIIILILAGLVGGILLAALFHLTVVFLTAAFGSLCLLMGLGGDVNLWVFLALTGLGSVFQFSGRSLIKRRGWSSPGRRFGRP